MELRHLRYFVTVAEELHFTRAAERLGLGQPPLSQQIRQLEEEIGSPLFHRLSRGVELTDVGRVFLKGVVAVLADLERAKFAAQRTARGEEGEVRIGLTVSTSCHPLVPAIVRDFEIRFPAVRVSLDVANSTMLAEAVREGRMDAAFVRTPFAEREGLSIFPLVDEELLVALPGAHPLAERERVPLGALAGEDIVLYPRRSAPGLYDAVIAACRDAGFEPRVVQEAESPALLGLVAAGLGLSIVPVSMQHMRPPLVAYRSIEGEALTAQISLIQRANDPSAAVRNLAIMARHAAKDAGAHD